MRKRIRLEEFIFRRLPGALVACYSRLGLCLFLCATAPLREGGLEDGDTVRLIKVEKVTVTGVQM